MKILAVLRKTDEVLSRVLKVFAVGLSLVIAFVLLARVILRLPFFTSSMAWSEEIVELTMAWMILTMATLLFRDGEHFRVELVEKRWANKPVIKYFNLFVTLVSLLFVGLLLYYGIKFMIPQTQFSPILKINHRFYYASVPVNAFLMLCYLIRDLVRNIQAFFRPRCALPKPMEYAAE
ncbi:MAG TPA: TRAP transporter small permease subunit [Candidatus Limiplasma sp.]|nr:TRAP transporter small permease subunit [Candidatus Limiplasma sp.]HRX08641.1 TRAP transporter small permease subunit [Candidatus Limiplasma sp.]